MQPINRRDVCHRRRFKDVCAQTPAADLSPAVLKFDLHLAHRIAAFGNRADAVIAEIALDAGEALDGRIDGVNRAVAEFTAGAPQADDITLIAVRRVPA